MIKLSTSVHLSDETSSSTPLHCSHISMPYGSKQVLEPLMMENEGVEPLGAAQGSLIPTTGTMRGASLIQLLIVPMSTSAKDAEATDTSVTTVTRSDTHSDQWVYQ